MRRVALALLVLATLPATAHADAPKNWHPHVNEARAWALSRAGQVSFAVRTEKDFWAFHPDRVAHSASVIKAMFMVAYLNRARVRDRPLQLQGARAALGDDPPLGQQRGDHDPQHRRRRRPGRASPTAPT